MATKTSTTKNSDTPPEPVKVRAQGPIKHDGKDYVEGDDLPAMDASQAQQLVDLGCAIAIG